MRRRLTEVLERRKEMMIAALWANSGFEGQQGADARRAAIEELEEHYDSAVRNILMRDQQEEEIDKDNPFFAAAERGLQRIAPVKKSTGTVADAVEEDEEEDQFEGLEIDQ
jgi:hypothetical protein